MSSSSPTSSIPPLPAELILHILHLAYPLHAEDDYTGRSRDVLQCCLVSKQWKELAELVLWQSITITSSRQITELAQQPGEKRDLTRNLALRLSHDSGSPPAQVSTTLQLFPAVKHVRVFNASRISLSQSTWPAGPVCLSYFECLSHLRSLVLDGACNYQFDSTTLPRLQAFRLRWFPDQDDVPALLNSAATPALRHLKADFLDVEPQPERLVDLLDVVEVNAGTSKRLDVVFQHPFRNVLVNISLSDLSDWGHCECFTFSLPYPPRHLRLIASPISWSILDNIFLLSHRPESLLLPLHPSPSTDAYATDDSAREAFLQRCKDESVEVRWYRPAEEEWREVGCREFREYVEERGRREELEA